MGLLELMWEPWRELPGHEAKNWIRQAQNSPSLRTPASATQRPSPALGDGVESLTASPLNILEPPQLHKQAIHLNECIRKMGIIEGSQHFLVIYQSFLFEDYEQPAHKTSCLKPS